MNTPRPLPPPPAPGDVAPGHALQWISAGWRLFMQAPGTWAVQALIFIIVITALGFLPVLGWAAAPIALPVLVAGMLAGAQALDRGQALRVDHLFEGLRRHPGNLLLVGVFHLPRSGELVLVKNPDEYRDILRLRIANVPPLPR